MPGPDDDFDVDVAPGTKSTVAQGSRDEFDFEVEMWGDAPFADDPIPTPSNQTDPVKPSTVAPPLNQGEDQDMWDLVDEFQAQPKSTENPNRSQAPPAPVEDDDWDSMYA